MKNASVQADSMRASSAEMTDYSSEDVQQILAIALENSDIFSAAHLQEMARDLSVDDVALSKAIETWQVNRAHLLKNRQRRQTFYRQALLPYLVVNTFLMLLNLSLSGSITWAIYPLLGWGAGLFLGPCRGTAIYRGVS